MSAPGRWATRTLLIDTLKAEVAKLKAEVERIRTKLDIEQAVAGGLQVEEKELRAQLAAERAEVARLKAEVERMRHLRRDALDRAAEIVRAAAEAYEQTEPENGLSVVLRSIAEEVSAEHERLAGGES